MNTPTVCMFVYGTLRSGGGLEQWLDASTTDVRSATASGALYSLGAYPCAMFDEQGTIVGDVRFMYLDANVMSCIDMEIHAGYELVEIEVTDQYEHKQKAWAFHYPDKLVVRELIPHGDWFRYEEEHPVRKGVGRFK